MPGNIGKYQIIRTIGSGGSCKVKLGLNKESGEKVAVKVMNPDMDAKTKELVLIEVQALAQLGQHLNVIRQYEYGTGKYEKTNGVTKNVTYIVLELATGGELFDFIAQSGRFPEPIARYYFKQFMDGLDHCHSKSIAHRDLKPENLLLDGDFNLKLGDFGFAAPLEGRDGSGFLTTKLGTLNYMAPEIHLKQPYQGKQVDLFAAAIILFIMVAQHPPFTTATSNDPFYKCLAGNRSDVFWRTHCKSKPNGENFFSPELKELLTCMLQLEPTHRPSMTELLAHPWMQGPMPSAEEVRAEFKKRHETVQASMEADRQQKALEKEARIQGRRQEINLRRSAQKDNQDIEEIEDLITKPKKEMDSYEPVFVQNTEFFSTYNPDMIEEAMLNYLHGTMIEPIVHDSKYKLKFEKIVKDEETGEENKVLICMRIFKVDQNKSCVEFTRLNGLEMYFYKEFINYKDNVLGFANDATLSQ